jgi:hypothetical protein
MVKNLKKYIAILVTFSLIVTAFAVQVYGCARCDKFDENGRGFYLEYNANYTIESMVFPDDGYIHFKYFPPGSFDRPNTPQGFVGNIYNTPYESLIRERFFFTFFSRYDGITRPNLMFVEGYNFALETAFVETFDIAMELLNDDITEIGYEVSVRNMSIDGGNESEALTAISDHGYIRAARDVLGISANIYAHDWSYATAPIPVRGNFHDPIDVFVRGEPSSERVVAISIYEDEVEEIPTFFDSYNKLYRFEITKPGVYALVTRIPYIDYQAFEENLRQDNPIIDLADLTGTVMSRSMLQEIAQSGKNFRIILNEDFSYTIIADSIGQFAGDFDLRFMVDYVIQARTVNNARIPANSILIQSHSNRFMFNFDVLFHFTSEQLEQAGISGDSVNLFRINGGNINNLGNVTTKPNGDIEILINQNLLYVISEENLVPVTTTPLATTTTPTTTTTTPATTTTSETTSVFEIITVAPKTTTISPSTTTTIEIMPISPEITPRPISTTLLQEIDDCMADEENCEKFDCAVHGATAYADNPTNSDGNPHTGVVLGIIPAIIAGSVAVVSRRKIK